MMKTGDMYRLACGSKFARLREFIEWNGWGGWMVEFVSTSTHSTPFSLEIQTDDQVEYWLKNATAVGRDEWIEAVAKATKIRADIHRKRREREGAERFGVHVKRSASDYGSRREPGQDVIIRATKTRWVGLNLSYRRGGGPYKSGTAIGKSFYDGRPSIDDDDLKRLEEMAAGRDRVDFVQERRQAQVTS